MSSPDTRVAHGAVFILTQQAHANNPVGGDCSFNGHKLYGKIQVVTSFPDVKV